MCQTQATDVHTTHAGDEGSSPRCQNDAIHSRRGYCHTHPGCLLQVACDKSWVHGVTVPMHTDPVVVQLHPDSLLQALCVLS